MIFAKLLSLIFLIFILLPSNRASVDFMFFDFFFLNINFNLYFQFSNEFFFNYIVNYVGIIVLLLIYFLLICNLFSFSIKYYLVNLFIYKELYSIEKIVTYPFLPNFFKKTENLIF